MYLGDVRGHQLVNIRNTLPVLLGIPKEIKESRRDRTEDFTLLVGETHNGMHNFSADEIEIVDILKALVLIRF